MNKSGNENRSVRNTKKKLREGLWQLMEEKTINSITVKELTELVDVNRGTFYFHYSDVYDMLHQIEDEFFRQFEQVLNDPGVGKNGESAPYLNEVFAFLGENQDLCRILLGHNGDMVFVDRVKKLVDEKCSRFWKAAAPDSDSKRFELYNAFIINGCIGVIEKWLANGLKESPEEISELAATVIVASAKACITQ